MSDEIANLSDAEKAALAKADAAGVSVVQKDGTVTELAKSAPAANATADVTPAAKPAATDGKPQRPDNVPEKFWNAETGAVNTEALLKSYTELEKVKSKPAEPVESKPATMGEPAKTPEQLAAEAAAKAAEPAKTPEQLAAEANTARQSASDAATADLASTGKISDASYAKLAAAGYSRAQVDTYVEGQQAKATLQLNAMYDVVGGKSSFDTMVSWGTTNYSEAEQQAFNSALRSGDKGQQQMAVAGLKARYTNEFGKGGKPVDTNNSVPKGNAFTSRAELTAAMSDARYTRGDAAFHREVAERIAASARNNVDIGLYVQ